jgi:XPB/Ssl2-like helicase family protein
MARAYLAAFAREVAPDRFSVDLQSLAAALAEGRSAREIRDFLVSRAGEVVPDAVEALLKEVEAGARSLRDASLARLIECADPQLASRLATHPRTRRLCLRAGPHHVAVPAANEKAFARALRQIGLPWPTND